MVMRAKENLVGAWAVLIGVILAVILGLFQSKATVGYLNWIHIVLVFMGLIVGIMITGSREINTFLIAAIALVIAGYIGKEALISVGTVGLMIRNVLDSLLIMFIPATIIVAIKSVFSISSV